MRLSIIAALLLVTTGAATAQVSFRQGRVPATDTRGYDVLHCDFAVELVEMTPQTPRIAGQVDLRLVLLDPAPTALRLDLVDEFTVSEVAWATGGALFTHEGDSLLVAMPSLVAPGDTLEISVSYAGQPPRHGTALMGLLRRTRDNGDPAVGNVNEPYSSHSWFPCKDHPSDKFTLTMDVTATSDLTVAAVGRLLEVVDAGGGRQTWRWRTDHPVAAYLVSLAASPYDTWHEDCGGIPLDFHAFAEHRAYAEVAFAPTCDMLQWLEDLVGPYPFADEKYAQAEVAIAYSMENQTVSAMSQAAISLPDSAAHDVTVHELAHHWFGNSLTPRDWRDIWLNEGFARYVELLWRENTRGEASYRRYLQRLRPDDQFVGDGLLGDPDPVLPNALPYDKGAWVLHMLRLHLGDGAFFQFLHDYATDPDLAYGNTDREIMIAAASRAAGHDLTAFFAPWLDTEALPLFAARWDGTRVEISQEQTAPVFPLTVPVTVWSNGASASYTVRMDDRLAAFTHTGSSPIDSVVVDPDHLLLRTTTDPILPGILAAQPRPNPSYEGTHLGFWLDGTDRVAAAVYDVRGRRVYRTDLGAFLGNSGGDPHMWSWRGNDDAGRRLPAGVYWLELRSTRDRTVRKVTLLR